MSCSVNKMRKTRIKDTDSQTPEPALTPEQLLQEMRAATAGVHRSIESSPLSRALLSPQVDKYVFQEFLRASYDCHEPLERHLARILGEEMVIDRWQYHFQSADLARDLECPPGRAGAVEEVGLPERRAYCIGGLYVLWGARFGKSVIARHLRNAGLSDAKSSAYLNSSGPIGWRVFLKALDCESINACFARDALNGAEDFFQVFQRRWNLWN